jgi:hypothetical protein
MVSTRIIFVCLESSPEKINTYGDYGEKNEIMEFWLPGPEHMVN